MIKNILKNKIFKYIFSRYAIYAIQFINTLIIAKILSPFDFGIWSFTQLIIVYFLYFDLGIPSSFNAISSIHINNKKYIGLNFNASLSLNLFLCSFISLIFLLNILLDLNFGHKYNFNQHSFYVILIVILSYFNNLFINLFRIYNKLGEITFFQAIVQIMTLSSCLIFQNNIINNILIAILIAHIISLCLFIYNSPIAFKLNFSRKHILKLQKSGFYFFIYNASFYFIIMSTRSVISYFYKVEEFGFFNFAFSLAGIVELIISSFMFLIFPKMINKFSSLNNKDVLIILKKLQKTYNVIMSLMSFIAISMFPLVTHFFPNYSNSIIAFNLIILTKLIITNSFGSPEILIARKKEKSLALAALFTVLINVVLTIVFATMFNVTFEKVILGTFISYFIYVIILNKISMKTLNTYTNHFDVFKYSFNLTRVIPIIIGLVFTLIKIQPIYYLLLVLIFCLTNYKSILTLKDIFKQIISNPKITDL